MSDAVQGNWYFAHPIYQKQLHGFEQHQNELRQWLLGEREEQPGETLSNVGGWHSNSDLHLSSNTHVRWLMSQCSQIADACIRDFNKDRYYGGMLIAAAWAIINERGDWNAPHNHLPADWSGVVYVAVEEPVPTASELHHGDILFLNPLVPNPRQGQAAAVNYHPRNGMLLLFPSYLMHMVSPHRSDQPRISISFNIRVATSAEEAELFRQRT